MRYSVAKLKDAGFGVKVNHYRKLATFPVSEPVSLKVIYDNFGDLKFVAPTGGYTEVVLETPYGEELRRYATCRDEEQYNRKLGTKIAIAAALKSGDLAYQHNRVIYFRNPKVGAEESEYCEFSNSNTCRFCNPKLWIKVKL